VLRGACLEPSGKNDPSVALRTIAEGQERLRQGPGAPDDQTLPERHFMCRLDEDTRSGLVSTARSAIPARWGPVAPDNPDASTVLKMKTE
jgi:hypothetical protein